MSACPPRRSTQAVQIIIIIIELPLAWGIAVFGEQVRGGPILALNLVPLIALVGSVFLLSRSPALRATAGESPGEAKEDAASAKDKASP